MNKSFNIIRNVIACREGHLAPTYLCLAGVQGNVSLGTTLTRINGVDGNSVVNSAFKLPEVIRGA